MLIGTNLLVLRYLKVRNNAGVQRHNVKFNFKSNERTIFKGTYSYQWWKTTLDGGTLPEVVVVGHKKTIWEKLIEYIQSIPGYDSMVEYQSRTYEVYM